MSLCYNIGIFPKEKSHGHCSSPAPLIPGSGLQDSGQMVQCLLGTHKRCFSVRHYDSGLGVYTHCIQPYGLNGWMDTLGRCAFLYNAQCPESLAEVWDWHLVFKAVVSLGWARCHTSLHPQKPWFQGCFVVSAAGGLAEGEGVGWQTLAGSWVRSQDRNLQSYWGIHRGGQTLMEGRGTRVWWWAIALKGTPELAVCGDVIF